VEGGPHKSNIVYVSRDRRCLQHVTAVGALRGCYLCVP